MLRIFNTLKPFFEDNYIRIGVREYARLMKISPPSASKTLNELQKENLLNKEKDRRYIYYSANRENYFFITLMRAYQYYKLSKIGLIEYLTKELINPIIILFGSSAKAEVSSKSDIDIAIFTVSKKELNLKKFQSILKRDIQIFMFKSPDEAVNKNLLNNIYNGFILGGDF